MAHTVADATDATDATDVQGSLALIPALIGLHGWPALICRFCDWD